MYRFNWEQISTDTLAAKCKSISNDQQGSIEIIKRNIGHILKSTGGLAIANTEWERAHQENVSFKLFHEALKHYLKEKFSFSTASPGYFIDNSNQLQSNAQIDPNNATEKSLEALPILGPTLSARIVK